MYHLNKLCRKKGKTNIPSICIYHIKSVHILIQNINKHGIKNYNYCKSCG